MQKMIKKKYQKIVTSASLNISPCLIVTFADSEESTEQERESDKQFDTSSEFIRKDL